MDLSILEGRRILVTGSTGFKGSWLCSWLLETGAKVSGFALPPAPDAPLFDQLRLGERIDQHVGDIRDLAAVQRMLDQVAPEIIIHLAAQSLVRLSYDDPKSTFDVNVGGAVNLLEAVRSTPSVRALVFITSDKCYRNQEWAWGYRENDPLGGSDPYSASKGAAELVFTSYNESYLKGRGLLAATARAGNVIGGGDFSRDRIVPDCIRALMRQDQIEVRNPGSTRPWQHVLEPLSGYLTLATRLFNGDEQAVGAWNFGPDPENVRSVEELTRHVIDAWGSGSLKVTTAPNAPHEARLLMLSSDKAKSILGWRPRWNFSRAIDESVHWYKEVHGGAGALEVTGQQIERYLAGAPSQPHAAGAA